MTTKVIRRPLSCCLKADHRWRFWLAGRCFGLSRTQVVLLVVSCLLARAAHIQGYKPNHATHGHSDKSCKVEQNVESNAVAFPGGDQDEDGKKNEEPPTPASPTGQRVAGHLLAVMLLASVAAAIIEAVRARMAQCKSSPKSSDSAGKDSETHHSSSSVHGASGKAPRRAALQEKSQSQDISMPRARSSSAGVSSHKEGAAAAAATALAASRAQKALRARLLGGRPLPLSKTGATPPLLRRSSFPVTRGSTSGKDPNNGSPSMLSRKQSIDSGDDEHGDFQKRRVRIIRRF